jgi:enterochelin esterase-like enzyme
MNSIYRILIILVISFLPFNVYSQVSRGTVKEGLIIQSKILNKDIRYTIYLPFDYESSNRYYPVVYLLHGYTDNDMAWIQFGEANMIADEGIANRDIPPMILVMPDAGITRYINNYDNSVRYEDFFFQEFIPYIESHYRIRADKTYRGIAGLSMGGFGTLVYSFRHTDKFAACAAFSVGIRTDEEVINYEDVSWEKEYTTVYGPKLKGKDRLTPHYYSTNLFYLIKNTPPQNLNSVRIYIDCGDKDFLYKGNSLLHVMLNDYNISHEYRVREGGHRWSYWRSGLLDALKFIGTSFHQQ